MKRILVLFCSLLLSACTTTTHIVQTNTFARTPKPAGCKVTLLRNKSDVSQNLQHLADIDIVISRNAYFGGEVNMDRDVYPEIRRKVCVLGGDVALITATKDTSTNTERQFTTWVSIYQK